jgi:hypothetical protein
MAYLQMAHLHDESALYWLIMSWVFMSGDCGDGLSTQIVFVEG